MKRIVFIFSRSVSTIRKATSLALIMGLVISCGQSNDSNSDGTIEVSSNSERKISRSDYGDKWPFTVEEGVLKCLNDGVIFTVNGKSYGINGRAKTDGYADPEEIWAVDSSLSDANNILRKDVQFIIDDGRKLCN